MYIHGVPNLKETILWEDHFNMVQVLLKWCGEEKCDENWTIFGNVANYS